MENLKMRSAAELAEASKGMPVIWSLRNAAVKAENWKVRAVCADLLAYGVAELELDPEDGSEGAAMWHEAAAYLDALGIGSTYGEARANICTYRLANAEETAARLLTVSETAKELGVNRQRVHQLIRTGKLDAAKRGSAWMVDAASVAARKGAE